MKKIIDAFPRSAHPMGVLSSLTSALTAFNPKAVNVNSKEEMDHAAELMIAKFSPLCLDLQKNSRFTINHGDNSLNYVENFYKMAFRMPNQEFEIDPVVVDALDKLLILHADHEQNCSTSTVRMVGSAHTGLLLLFLLGFLHFGDHFTVVLTKQ
jgi:citrate synthase